MAPVLGGIGFFALLGLVTYLIAAVISDNAEDAEGRLLSTTFRVGRVEQVREIVAEDGPIIFPDLIESGGTRTLVLWHEGDDPTNGWRVFFGYPNDRTVDCKVEQEQGERTFRDCEGRAIDVLELAPAAGVRPVVENRETLIIDLREAVAETATTTTG